MRGKDEFYYYPKAYRDLHLHHFLGNWMFRDEPTIFEPFCHSVGGISDLNTQPNFNLNTQPHFNLDSNRDFPDRFASRDSQW
ncbi:MAG TPA: hypothetical protein P5031_08320 [Candidatus Syntrophosphaera sp.]|jgi:hypothetical protein|nr:hypothetical protein [Thermotogaceae bacterium]HRQ68553.1 hypothetical protein [Candidatus Syntrophosphaera sp.]